jgi:hypothetical protein
LLQKILDILKEFVPEAWWQRVRRAFYLRRYRRTDRRENRRITRSRAPILIVSEADNAAHAYADWLAWAEQHRPDLRRAIRLDRVPGASARGAGGLHAWVQDPVRERDEALFDRLQRLERQVGHHGGGVVNQAGVLSNTLRDVMWERLAGLPLRVASVARVPADPHDPFMPERFPVMVRPRWGHGLPMELLPHPEGWRTWRRRTQGDGVQWVTTEFIDVRGTDALYRKYRYISFGGRGLARHLIVSRRWEVRPKDRILTDATREEELAFVHGEMPYATVLEQARAALGFDVAAFDFSYDATGRLVLWEVNPFPDLSTPRTAASRYLQDVVHATYGALADFYEKLLQEARR